MQAGFFQFNTAFGRKQENLEKVRAATGDTSLDLLVLPEFFATGYQFASKDEVAELAEPVPHGETTEFIVSLSKDRDIYIVAGLPERDGNIFFNENILRGIYSRVFVRDGMAFPAFCDEVKIITDVDTVFTKNLPCMLHDPRRN